MRIKNRQYEIDPKSNRVYYTEDGSKGIFVAESLAEYNAMVEQERFLATTYFEFKTDSMPYCKMQVVNSEAIINLLQDISDIEERTQTMMRYFKMKEELGI